MPLLRGPTIAHGVHPFSLQRVINSICPTTGAFSGGLWLKGTYGIKVLNSFKILIIATTLQHINSLHTLKQTNFISSYTLLILVYMYILCIFVTEITVHTILFCFYLLNIPSVLMNE